VTPEVTTWSRLRANAHFPLPWARDFFITQIRPPLYIPVSGSICVFMEPLRDSKPVDRGGTRGGLSHIRV